MAQLKQIKAVVIDKLIPYVNNAKQHSEEQVTKIASSIREFGFVNPVLIDKDYNIIAGHGRVMAAKKLGWDEVPCLFVEGLTEAQRKAYILADNRLGELAEWDMELVTSELEMLQEMEFDIDLTGFELAEPDVQIQEDEIPEEVEPRCKKGDIWQLGEHRLICGDSTETSVIEKLMGGATADLLLTDPPYNVALGYHMRPSEAKQLNRRTDGLVIENDAFNSEEDFLHFLESAFTCGNNALKPGGVFYIWHAHNWSKPFFTAVGTVGWQIRECLVWNKSVFAMGRQDYQWKHEPCIYGWKDGAAHYFIDDRTQATVIEDAKEINPDKMKKTELVALVKDLLTQKISTTVLCEDKPSRSEMHPTMKPIKLFARLIKNSSKIGENVLDIFGGSGSTLIACEQLKRKCYMCELDEHYCDVIIQRWENFTGQKAVLLNE
jgi:site-specific DNA-methyltransferase (adenine-specific)